MMRSSETNNPLRMLTVDEIFGRARAAVPWPSSSAVVGAAVELMPSIADDATTDLIERLASAIVDLQDELRAVRVVLSEVLAQSHGQLNEIRRLRTRLADVLEEGRRERTRPFGSRSGPQDCAGQYSAGQSNTEEKSLYGKRRIGTGQGSTGQLQNRTAQDRTADAWT